MPSEQSLSKNTRVLIEEGQHEIKGSVARAKGGRGRGGGALTTNFNSAFAPSLCRGYWSVNITIKTLQCEDENGREEELVGS